MILLRMICFSIYLVSPVQEMDEGPVLFAASLHDGHAKQGLLGDCWFLCACTFLLKNKHLMNKVESCADVRVCVCACVCVRVCVVTLAMIGKARQVCLYSTVQTQGRSQCFTKEYLTSSKVNTKKVKCMSQDIQKYQRAYRHFPLYAISKVLSLKCNSFCTQNEIATWNVWVYSNDVCLDCSQVSQVIHWLWVILSNLKLLCPSIKFNKPLRMWLWTFTDTLAFAWHV